MTLTRQKSKKNTKLTRLANPPADVNPRPDLVFLRTNVPRDLLKAHAVKQLGNRNLLQKQIKAEVLESDNVSAADSTVTGGKGSSLAILNLIEGITVPKFFCVTTKAFERVVADLIDYEKLESLCSKWWNTRDENKKSKITSVSFCTVFGYSY
mmetsp:Transcript_18226/g.22483  ORF Transcript_18226/g.22483 Transcript_18226/m.22483 type:complete len:153 (+) Transcript_18226:128-586(+)